MRVRPATPDDLPAIVAIVNHAITTGAAHFASAPWTVAEAAVAFGSADRYPWLVAEAEGVTLGFAKAGPWKERAAYAWSVELGVYVAPDQQGRGVGKALYRDLIPCLEEAGFRTLVAGITLPNPASVRLHEGFGFARAGTFPRIGYKLGAWHDVGYWVRHLGAPTEPPCPRPGQIG